ncbi:MAG TPA: peptidoglycan DD-metalloendopeptidase family protein [Xanthomonadaceae bacterium]|nr:peptidoglycan DD-metalloendopeptidase family protein [Xanthomonadaceae bacterium]
MTGLLLFLAGVLVGANAVYFLLVSPSLRDVRTPAAQPPVASEARGRTAATAIPPVQPTPRATTRPAAPGPIADTAPAAPGATPLPAPANLRIPVAGVAAAQLADTFNDRRDGGRAHEALDIMAPRGTPVLAAADGSIAKLFTSQRGGLTVYEFDPTGTWAYYYAHLDRYAPGLAEGRQVRRDEVIGYVGSTGDADASAPHLHFAIFVLGPEKHWWQGTAIDPYPLLGGTATR